MKDIVVECSIFFAGEEKTLVWLKPGWRMLTSRDSLIWRPVNIGEQCDRHVRAEEWPARKHGGPVNAILRLVLPPA